MDTAGEPGCGGLGIVAGRVGACREEGLSFEVAGCVVPGVSGSQPAGDLAERLSGQKDGGEAGL